MKIKQILSKNCILANMTATNKESVVEELSVVLSNQFPNIQKEEIVQILLEREKLGSTGIGNGVAIPHGKLASIPQIIAGFGRSLSGVPFDSQDGKPAHLFFVLLAPENAASLHLKALARLSRLLKDVQFRNKLMRADGPDHLYHEIISEDEKF